MILILLRSGPSSDLIEPEPLQFGGITLPPWLLLPQCRLNVHVLKVQVRTLLKFDHFPFYHRLIKTAPQQKNQVWTRL